MRWRVVDSLLVLCVVAALMVSSCYHQPVTGNSGPRTAAAPAEQEQAASAGPDTAHDEGTPGHPDDEHPAHEPMDVDPATAQPSGELVDGVRLIRMSARRYEFSPSPLVVNVGERVRILARSEDVPHSLEIEGYGVDARIDPGRETSIEFTADKAGKFVAHCDIYCGPGHHNMYTTLVVRAR